MHVASALLFLFPDADPLRDYRVQDDGKGAYIAVWNLANPQPTPRQLQAASDAVDAARSQADSEAQALRTQVRNVAQSTVGVVITNLESAQVRSLLAVLLWKAGAIDKDGKIRPLNDWAD